MFLNEINVINFLFHSIVFLYCYLQRAMDSVQSELARPLPSVTMFGGQEGGCRREGRSIPRWQEGLGPFCHREELKTLNPHEFLLDDQF